MMFFLDTTELIISKQEKAFSNFAIYSYCQKCLSALSPVSTITWMQYTTLVKLMSMQITKVTTWAWQNLFQLYRYVRNFHVVVLLLVEFHCIIIDPRRMRRRVTVVVLSVCLSVTTKSATYLVYTSRYHRVLHGVFKVLVV